MKPVGTHHPLSAEHVPLFSMILKRFLLTEVSFSHYVWDERWGEGKLLVLLDWLWVSEPSWFSEQSWENVVIKFANLLGRPCSGSWLNLCAAGIRLALNSSTDERRADLSTGEARPHWFLPTCRIDGGLTVRAGIQTEALSLLLSLLLGPSVDTPECK